MSCNHNCLLPDIFVVTSSAKFAFFCQMKLGGIINISFILLKEECIGSINLSKTGSILLLDIDKCEIQCSCILYFDSLQFIAFTTCLIFILHVRTCWKLFVSVRVSCS